MRRIDFPKSIRVGFRTYRVMPFAPAGPLVHRDRNGAHCFETAIIMVDDTLDPQQGAQVLLHEILHACWAVGGLDEETDEERIVTIFARVLTQVWQDNPKVMKWIGKNAKRSIA